MEAGDQGLSLSLETTSKAYLPAMGRPKSSTSSFLRSSRRIVVSYGLMLTSTRRFAISHARSSSSVISVRAATGGGATATREAGAMAGEPSGKG